MLLSSSVHITCVVHHAGPIFGQQLKAALLPFVRQRRVSIVVLGDHVRRWLLADMDEWAEKEGQGWDEVEVGLLVPVSSLVSLIRVYPDLIRCLTTLLRQSQRNRQRSSLGRSCFRGISSQAGGTMPKYLLILFPPLMVCAPL
jgi:hypothetical protein